MAAHRSLFTLEWEDEGIEGLLPTIQKDVNAVKKPPVAFYTHTKNTHHRSQNGRLIRPLMQKLPNTLVNPSESSSNLQKYSSQQQIPSKSSTAHHQVIIPPYFLHYLRAAFVLLACR